MVCNFSPGVCRNRSVTPPFPGSDVMLCIYPDDSSGGLVTQLARICWARDYEFGVAFVAIDPEVMQQLASLWFALDRKTTLTRIPPHRLRALILEDLTRYPGSSTSDVNRRIGVEISARTVKRALDVLVAEHVVRFEGERRWRKYWLVDLSYSYKGQGGE